jgi:hypothetical protein
MLAPIATIRRCFCQCRITSKLRATGLGLHFQKYEFSNPDPPQSRSAVAFLRRAFEMIFELIATLILMQCATTILRLIERRRDVLYYVSESDPHRFL